MIDVTAPGHGLSALVGDGSTNDSTNLQAIVNWIIANRPNGGETIFFPTKEAGYLLSTAITINAAVAIRFYGENRLTKLIDNVSSGYLFTFSGACTLCDFDTFEIAMKAGVTKTKGGYIRVTSGSNTMSIGNMRIQHSGYDGIVIDGVGGLTGGINLDRLKFLPGAPTTTRSAIRLSNTAGIFVTKLDINYGVMTMVDAGIVIDGGCDTIIFSDSGSNQIGGTLGVVTGGRSLLIQNTNGAFNPRWVRFMSCYFESNARTCIQIDAGNQIEFHAPYAISGDSALVINGGNGIKLFGGVFGNCWKDIIQINGGQDIEFHGPTVVGGSQALASTYSGIVITSSTTRVEIYRPKIGDIITLEGVREPLKYGILLPASNAVTLTDPIFGVEASAGLAIII